MISCAFMKVNINIKIKFKPLYESTIKEINYRLKADSTEECLLECSLRLQFGITVFEGEPPQIYICCR